MSPYGVFVSHPWDQSFRWMVSKLEEAQVESVWLDIFFISQDPLGQKVSTNLILPQFERRLKLQKNMIVVTKKFEKYCSRLWCVYELLSILCDSEGFVQIRMGEEIKDIDRGKIDLKQAECRFKSDKDALTNLLIVMHGDYMTMKELLLKALDGRYLCASTDDLKAKKLVNFRTALQNHGLFSRGELMRRAKVAQMLGMLTSGLLSQLKSLVGDQQMIATLFGALRSASDWNDCSKMRELLDQAERMKIPKNTPILYLVRERVRQKTKLESKQRDAILNGSVSEMWRFIAHHRQDEQTNQELPIYKVVQERLLKQELEQAEMTNRLRYALGKKNRTDIVMLVLEYEHKGLNLNTPIYQMCKNWI